MNSKWRSLALGALLAAVALAAGPSYAQEPPAANPPAPVAWSSLSPDQQKLLSHFGSQWNTLPPARQQALAHGSERWLGMSDAEKNQARERFSRWQALPPEQRQALRSRWQKFQALSPRDQAIVRQNYRRFQQLPPERRQALREQWRNASPAQRQQMIERARELHQRQMERGGGGHAPARPPSHH
jgi:Protein of unknown function (DUF3106)